MAFPQFAELWKLIDLLVRKDFRQANLAGMILKNEKPPMHIIETASFYELIERNPNSVLTPDYVKKLSELLKDGAWEKYPEAHAFFENMLSHNYKDSFELIAGKDFQKGEWFRFVNGDESFEIYPRFGGTLQNWCFGNEIIIPGNMDAVLKRGNIFEKGGYRSYTAIGGLRPIWALGNHHNPCILWNFPLSWKSIADSPDVKTVELSGSFYHVDVTYRISIKKGTTGFTYSLKAVKKQNYLLTIDCGEVGGSGFYVDWSSTFMTPDLHGIYRPLKKGDVTETQWIFRIDRED